MVVAQTYLGAGQYSLKFGKTVRITGILLSFASGLVKFSTKDFSAFNYDPAWTNGIEMDISATGVGLYMPLKNEQCEELLIDATLSTQTTVAIEFEYVV